MIEKLALIGMLGSLAGLVILVAVATYHRGADIDRRQAEMDELLAEQRKRLG